MRISFQRVMLSYVILRSYLRHNLLGNFHVELFRSEDRFLSWAQNKIKIGFLLLTITSILFASGFQNINNFLLTVPSPTCWKSLSLSVNIPFISLLPTHSVRLHLDLPNDWLDISYKLIDRFIIASWMLHARCWCWKLHCFLNLFIISRANSMLVGPKIMYQHKWYEKEG